MVFRLRHESEGSPPHKTETGSSSYRLTVHFQLLPTPPHGDGYFKFQRFWLTLVRTFTVLIVRPYGLTDSGIPAGMANFLALAEASANQVNQLNARQSGRGFLYALPNPGRLSYLLICSIKLWAGALDHEVNRDSI